jgi:hypothetical protein
MDMNRQTNTYFGNDAGFLAAIRGATHTALFALCKLNEIQFSAPWNPQAGGCR